MIDANRQAFQEEARELLAELESALLALDDRPSDMDLIQRTFRALHTIKGSGSMFGFDEMSRFTHQVETAFDHVREGRLAVTPDLVNITLAAGDQIRSMLEGSEANENSGEPQDILEKLARLVPPAAISDHVAARVSSPAMQRKWRISYRPAPAIFLHGTNPLLLLRELREFGRLEVAINTTALPDIRQMDPESCYLEWDLTLETTKGLDDIRGVFIFCEDDCELTIEDLSAQPASGSSESTAAKKADLTREPWTLGSWERRRDPYSIGGEKVSIRVSTEKVDSLINYVGELVVVQARLSQIASNSNTGELRLVAEEVERLTSGLRDHAMSMRMFPLKNTFERFRRLVHDLTSDLHKEVEFTTGGADTELDKTVIDQLNDPLLHLIRNSMDHGIEAPEVRAAAGKPRVGRIHLSAAYSGANVLIAVSDDGCGLDREAIRGRAIEKGMISPDAQLTESEVFGLILAPGFSTSKQVTDLSGRGVGMDVVRRSVESLHGLLEITSAPGEGTTVTLRLPLTLAIIDGLLVRVDAAHFVVPLASVLECVELTAEDVSGAHGKCLANVRGELVPYIRLRECFRVPGRRPEIEQIMIVETSDGRHGLAVDEVLGDHQTVIKNLGRVYRHVQVVSGATILGDGTVALILDPQRLVQQSIRAATYKLRDSSQETRALRN